MYSVRFLCQRSWPCHHQGAGGSRGADLGLAISHYLLFVDLLCQVCDGGKLDLGPFNRINASASVYVLPLSFR